MGYPLGVSGNGFLKMKQKANPLPRLDTLYVMAGTLVATLRIDGSDMKDQRSG